MCARDVVDTHSTTGKRAFAGFNSERSPPFVQTAPCRTRSTMHTYMAARLINYAIRFPISKQSICTKSIWATHPWSYARTTVSQLPLTKQCEKMGAIFFSILPFTRDKQECTCRAGPGKRPGLASTSDGVIKNDVMTGYTLTSAETRAREAAFRTPNTMRCLPRETQVPNYANAPVRGTSHNGGGLSVVRRPQHVPEILAKALKVV